jgi:uncharacterized OsmC-like protein
VALEMDIPLDAVKVSVEGDLDPRGVAGEPVDPRLQVFRVTVEASGPTAEQAASLEEAFRSRCPIFTTLTRSAPIELETVLR